MSGTAPYAVLAAGDMACLEGSQALARRDRRSRSTRGRLAALAAAPGPRTVQALRRGADWVVERSDGGRAMPAAPIGLYFARLWYWEALYPLIFAVEGLRAALTAAAPGAAGLLLD